MFALLAVVFLAAVGGASGDDVDEVVIRHPAVRDAPRDFDVCVSGISVHATDHIVHLRPDQSTLEAAWAVVGSEAGASAARRIAAFLEHRVSMALMYRAEFRHAVRDVIRASAPALFVTSQACDAASMAEVGGALLDRSGSWVMLDRNMLNVEKSTDWAFYFRDRPLSRVALGCGATAAMSDADLGGTVAKLAHGYLLPGGTLELVVNERRVGAIDAYVVADQDLWADALTASEFDAEAFGPLPPSLFGLGKEIEKEALCPSPAKSVSMTLTKRSPPVDARARPLPGVLSVLAINLERRRDRWGALLEETRRAGFQLPPTRLDAVDGAALDVTRPDVAAIFNLTKWNYGSASNAHQDHGYRKNVVACALSHLEAWRRISAFYEDAPQSIHLVLEDDVQFVDDFAERWRRLASRLVGDYTWGVLQLGVLDDRDLYGDEVVYDSAKRFSGRQRSFGAGAFAYALRPRTARALLALAAEIGIQQPVDWWLVERFKDIVAYKASPPLAASPQGEGRDSDNDEGYDQARLLLAQRETRRRDAEGLSAVVFEVIQPAAGAALRRSDDVDVKANVLVPGQTDVFVQRHALARICLSLGKLLPQFDSPQPVVAGVCKGVGARNFIAGASVDDEGWYVLNGTLVDEDGVVFSSSVVVFEIVDYAADAAPPTNRHPPTLPRTPNAAAGRAISVTASVDGNDVEFTCDANRARFDCVTEFCEGIQPMVECMARMASSFFDW